MPRVATFLSKYGQAFETTGKGWLFPSFSFVVFWLSLRRWVAWHHVQDLITVGFIIVINVAALALAPAAADDEADHLGPGRTESSGVEPKREKRRAWWGPVAERLRYRYRTLRLPGIIVGLVWIAFTIGFS